MESLGSYYNFLQEAMRAVLKSLGFETKTQSAEFGADKEERHDNVLFETIPHQTSSSTSVNNINVVSISSRGVPSRSEISSGTGGASIN